MERAQLDSDPAEWAALHRTELIGHLRRVVGRANGSPIDCDDLAQQVCLTARRRASDLRDRCPAALKCWHWRLARRVAMDAVRARRARKRGGPGRRSVAWSAGVPARHSEDTPARSAGGSARSTTFGDVAGTEPGRPHGLRPAPAPHEMAHQRELDAIVAAAVAELRETDRALIVCHYIEGRPLAELAEERGVTIGAVKGQVRRARQRLLARLEHLRESIYADK